MSAGTLTSLRRAAEMSHAMRGTAARGAVDELETQMAERGRVLAEACASLEATTVAGALPHAEREALAGMIREFGEQNRLLIEALQELQRQIIRCIADAEGHRKLSAYAR
ncbi:MAG TPA: hypothetical protein VMM80_04475 [Bacteroidota bacterium]|nr:hypothetical protein [Bacteroidota bacterium]